MNEFKNSQTGEALTHETITQEMQKLGAKIPENEPAEINADQNLSPEGSTQDASEKISESQEREYSEVEKEAMSEGWNPSGEKSAEEYLRAKPLYKKIHSLNRENKEMRNELKQLRQFLEAENQSNKQRAIEQLKEQRREAIRLGDEETFEKIEQEINKYQTEPQNQNSQTSPEWQKAIQDFQERNQEWLMDLGYKAEPMRAFVNEREQQLVRYNLHPDQIVEIIEKDLRDKFPDYFNSSNQKPKAAKASYESDASRINSNQKRKPTFSDLNPMQKEMAKFMERTTGKKVEAYIDDLINTGALSY